MIIYYSGTPGIRGGLPEELLDESVDIMTSMVEYGLGGKDRITNRRLAEVVKQRDHLLLGSWNSKRNRSGRFTERE